jgi:uncharacterized protein
MKISLMDLERGQLLFEDELDALTLELDPQLFSRPLMTKAEAQEQPDGWYILLRVHCIQPLGCDRCARLVDREFSLETRFYVAKADSLAAELDSDDLLIVQNEQKELDLSQIIRDLVVPEVQDHFLCDASCKGLCPACGSNLNDESCKCDKRELDSPFAALASLRNSEDEKKD